MTVSGDVIHINFIAFQTAGDFSLAVAVVRIGFHAHDTDGFVFLVFGQFFYRFLADLRHTAEGAAGPYILDAAFCYGRGKNALAEPLFPAEGLGPDVDEDFDVSGFQNFDKILRGFYDLVTDGIQHCFLLSIFPVANDFFYRYLFTPKNQNLKEAYPSMGKLEIV